MTKYLQKWKKNQSYEIALLKLCVYKNNRNARSIFVNLLWNWFFFLRNDIFIARSSCVEERRVSEKYIPFLCSNMRFEEGKFHPWRKSHHSFSWLHSNVRTSIIISNGENFCLSSRNLPLSLLFIALSRCRMSSEFTKDLTWRPTRDDWLDGKTPLKFHSVVLSPYKFSGDFKCEILFYFW